MRGVLAITLVALSALACSSSSSSGDDDAGTGFGSSSGSTSSSSGSTSSSGGTPDAGTCATLVLKSGATATVVARSGVAGAEWTSPADALTEDGKVASAVLDAATESQELRITDFAFGVPAGATIKGVEVSLRRQAQGTVYDGAVTLVGLDGQTPLVKYYEPAWPKSASGVHEYGGVGEMWNSTITAADVNKSTFGVSIWVKKDPAAGPATATIDALRLAVYYCQQ